MSKEEQGPDISWNDQIEELFRQTAEKSNALSMLHSSATQKYQRINTALNIPVIILSTIVGATSTEQLQENIAAFEVTLSPEIIMEINKIQEVFPNPAP
jgi:aryl-alcohol dehydrogenase-like predicted oxidoreductase